jgi:hypothetical protein
MTDGRSRQVPKAPRKSVRWTSFVGGFADGRRVRALAEETNPLHRVRVEHNRDTLLVHISNEDGQGWTTVAIDRSTREWSVAQRHRQLEAAEAAFANLYGRGSERRSREDG